MHRSLLVPMGLLAGALALGCGEQQPPTADPPAPSLSVERSTVPFGFGFGDGRRILFLGLTLEDLVSIFCTGTAFDNDQLNQLLVTRPDGSIKQQLQGKDVNVVVVEDAPFNQFFCDNPLAVPTFTGTARVVLNDGDVFVSGQRSDASQVHVTGTVADEGGGTWHLVAFSHAVLGPGSTFPDNLIVLNSVIQIHLTPIGR